jgi:hypothetical protein
LTQHPPAQQALQAQLAPEPSRQHLRPPSHPLTPAGLLGLLGLLGLQGLLGLEVLPLP